jgi:acyl-CoA dehydrogenase
VKRTLFTPEHEDFRHLVRDFIAKDVLPFYDEWLTAGVVPRDLYRRLAEIGVMGIQLPETYADAEQRDRWFPGLANGELYTALSR